MKGWVVCFVLAMLITACGSGSGEQAPSLVIGDTLSADSGEIALREKIFQERIASGDTLIAEPSRLLELLPTGFPGFTLEETNGQYLEFDNRRMSEATAEWSGKEGDLKISLIDYNRNIQTWNGLWDAYRSDVVQDNEAEYSGAWKAGLGENFGWMFHLKGAEHIRVVLGMDFRYLVTLEFSGVEDTGKVRTWVNGGDWSALKK